MLITLFTSSSVLPIILSILVSVLITPICAAVIFYQSNKRENEQKLPSPMEQVIDEVLRLEQQKSELEKKQEMLIWQMEAAALTKQDPRLAVVIAYQGVEAELQRVANLRYPKDLSEELDEQEPSVFHNISLLEEAIGSESAETLKRMRDLRNRIVLSFYRENVEAAELTDLRFEGQQMIDAVRTAFQVVEENLSNYPFSVMNCLDMTHPSKPGHLTCGVSENYMVIG